MTVERSAKPQPDSAKASAEAINEEICQAVAMGAPNKHASLEQAKFIATQLERAFVDRSAEQVLFSAEAMQARDEEMAARSKGAPMVGPATQLAENIEREAREAIKRRGVPEEHPTLKKAFLVAKALRDKDGERKRMAAREKRLAAQAA